MFRKSRNKNFFLRNKIMSKYKNHHHNCYALHINNHHIYIIKEPPKIFILSEIAYYYLYKNKIEDFNKYFGGPDLMFDLDTDDVKIWISILVDHIEIIESAYIFSVLQFFIEFGKSYKDIISDIRKKIINPKKNYQKKQKSKFTYNNWD